MSHVQYIEKAIEICGGTQAALAEMAGLSQSGVNWLLRGEGKVAPETAIKIELATGGKVHRSDLRPDLFKKGRAA